MSNTHHNQSNDTDAISCTDEIVYGKEFKLNPAIKKVWYIHALILVVSVLALWNFVEGFFDLFEYRLIVDISQYVIYGALLVWVLVFVVIGGYLQYRFSSYTIGKDALVIKTGAFIRKTTLIPYIRIQHTGHEQGIIMDHYGLVQLTIATASSSFVLDGLEKERANELTSLIAYAVEHAREDV